MSPNSEYMETVRTWVMGNRQNTRLACSPHYQFAYAWLARYDAERAQRRSLRQRRIVAVWLMGLALAAWLWRLL